VIVIHIERPLLGLTTDAALAMLRGQHSIVVGLGHSVLANKMALSLALRIGPIAFSVGIWIALSQSTPIMRFARLATRHQTRLATLV
jgi:hypothetical protein